jgi:prepilin-type N-terminal cleavage/methylation domain-containing protein
MNGKNSRFKGFTLMELVVAAAIFSVFVITVLTFYRMGSRIFSGGSWKQGKQKEAERFLNFVRERIGRASFPVVVHDSGAFEENKANFGYASGTYTIQEVPDTGIRLLCFTVCKAKIRNTPGVIMYHTLRAKKSPTNPKSFNLEIISTNDINSGKGMEFFTGSPFVFFEGAVNLSAFTGDPTLYDLGQPTSVHSIEDVTEISITGTTSLEGSQIIIELTFTHPKLELTKLYLKTSAIVGNGLTVHEQSSL